MKSSFIQVFVSCESTAQAKLMVESLLNDQIIACAQILPAVESHYRWQGKVTQDTETLLLLKSQYKHFEAIEATVKKLHSYDVPEIIAVPIVAGEQDYLNWINEQTNK